MDHPLVRGKLKVWVSDRKGRVRYKHEQPVRSFLANFAHWLRAFIRTGYALAVINDEPIVDMDGITRYIFNVNAQTVGKFGSFYGDYGCERTGILIGYGTTPPTPNDYKLEARYPHGTGAGYFEYGKESVGSLVTNSSKTRFKASRPFTNNSTETQTVSETGLGAEMIDIEGTNFKFLVIRDVLTTPVDVLAGEILTVEYTFEFVI